MNHNDIGHCQNYYKDLDICMSKYQNQSQTGAPGYRKPTEF